ncbi:hypothetical protein [Bremerella cremea]|uniref:hypothetical protein n=1 Tax=Bremerella cremea TaxID=1031537 RepID=UPI0031E9605F
MKKLALCLVAVVAASSFYAPSAYAIKPFADAFVEKYNLADPKTDAEKELAAAVKEAKCALCHGAKSKKVRNEYGVALDELLDKGDFSASRRKEEPEKVQEELFAALEKVEMTKSKSGETFGEKIKAGKLPAAEGTDTEG